MTFCIKTAKRERGKDVMVTCLIEKPLVRMYPSESLTGEVSDELVFGTRLEVLSACGIAAYCRTSYGYEGYVNAWELSALREGSEDLQDKKEAHILYAPCDVLPKAEYREKPLMHLHIGSEVFLTGERDDRFAACRIGGKKGYLPLYALPDPVPENLPDGFRIAAHALGFLGTPYRWGGKTEEGTDCSGLVFTACALSGSRIYRDAVFKEEYAEKIPPDKVQRGDIAYFSGHAAVMLDENEFVHASARHGRVVTGSFTEGDLDREKVLCFARVGKIPL